MSLGPSMLGFKALLKILILQASNADTIARIRHTLAQLTSVNPIPHDKGQKGT